MTEPKRTSTSAEIADKLLDLTVTTGQDEETGEYIYAFVPDDLADFILDRERRARIDELKMMRELMQLPSFSQQSINDFIVGKKPHFEYIKKRLSELTKEQQ